MDEFVADFASPDYQRCLKKLRRDYRHIDEDLAAAFEAIKKDRHRACHAMAVPSYGGTVWKYRCKSSDMHRGQAGGFRLLVYFDHATRTLIPICVYTHLQFANQPPHDDIKKWVGSLPKTDRGSPPVRD